MGEKMEAVEEIRWVETPPCGRCVPDAVRKVRPQCVGCTRLFAAAAETPAQKNEANNYSRLRAFQQKKRDQKIIALKQTGLSLREIGLMLGMPRSTVNNALVRAKKAHRRVADMGQAGGA